ncbi:MAG: hypothetical protein ABL949_08790 [Fimbriimonadaceae bacterium]
MKTRALIFSFLALGSAIAQDSINLERAFKTGESDKYKLDLNMATVGGQLAIKLELTQTTKVAHANGEADIESTLANMKVQFNGSDIPSDALGTASPTPIIVRYDKFMRPVGKQNSSARGIESFLGILRLTGMLVGKPIVVGQTFDIDNENKDTLTRTTGKIKIVELVNGVVKLESDINVKNPQTVDKPMNIKSVAKISVTDAKLVRVEGTVSGIPGGQGAAVESVSFVIEKA